MKKDTRKQWFNWLENEMKIDKSVYFLTGDLGFNFVETVFQKFPNRCINCGIAEQNMVGVATGLALMGKIPYCYSGKVFLNYRCLEQIRNAWMQNLDVRIAGTSASGFLGFTHNFQKGEVEPLKHLAKKLNRKYIRL